MLLQVGRSGCHSRVGVRETATAIACRNLFIGATFGSGRGHIASVSVVGRIFTHRMVGVPGWKEVQLPIALSAALAQCQGNEIDDDQSHQNTDQYQQGNAPTWYPRPRLGRGRELHLIHIDFRDSQIIVSCLLLMLYEL